MKEEATGVRDQNGTKIRVGDFIGYSPCGMSPMLSDWFESKGMDIHDQVFGGRVYEQGGEYMVHHMHIVGSEHVYPMPYKLADIKKRSKQSAYCNKRTGFSNLLKVLK